MWRCGDVIRGCRLVIWNASWLCLLISAVSGGSGGINESWLGWFNTELFWTHWEIPTTRSQCRIKESQVQNPHSFLLKPPKMAQTPWKWGQHTWFQRNWGCEWNTQRSYEIQVNATKADTPPNTDVLQLPLSVITKNRCGLWWCIQAHLYMSKQ